MIKYIFMYSKKYWLLFLISEICILITYTVALLLPINLRILTDDVLTLGKMDLFQDVLVNYIILFSIATGANLLYAYVWQTLSNNYIVDIKNKMFDKIINSKLSMYSDLNSGDVITRIDNDSEQFLNVIQKNIFHFINSIILCILILIIIANINIFVSLLLLITTIIPVIIAVFLKKRTYIYSLEQKKETSKLVGFIFEFVKSFRELKVNISKKWSSKFLFIPLKKYLTLVNKIKYIDFLTDKTTYFFNLLTTIFVYSFSTYLILNNMITIGVFLLLIQYIVLLHKKFNFIVRIFLDFSNKKSSIERVVEILELQEEENTSINIKEINKIEFKNVVFKYEDKVVLDNISFVINKGEKIAIVGDSGAGKSTIVYLLLNFYSPYSGYIYINDIDINKVNKESLRNAYGVVSQDNFIFNDSIKNNVTMLAEKDDLVVKSALQEANIFKNNCDINVNRKIDVSKQLSSGEVQRIKISRLFLKKNQSVVLDECTASLDEKTEKQILDKIYKKYEQNIIISITHKKNCIKYCDIVFLVKKSKMFIIEKSDAMSGGIYEK